MFVSVCVCVCLRVCVEKYIHIWMNTFDTISDTCGQSQSFNLFFFVYMDEAHKDVTKCLLVVQTMCLYTTAALFMVFCGGFGMMCSSRVAYTHIHTHKPTTVE